MSVKRRPQADRSEATRTALVDAARARFAERGFAAVGTEEIVRAAGVTRGALYHHFGGKQELFLAVFETVEQELTERLAHVALGAGDPLAGLRAGAAAFLDSADDPSIQRITLIDAPAVLGWERWRELGLRYGLGLVEAALGAAMDAGAIRRQPLRPLAHLLLGALDEAALLLARSDDPATRAEVGAVVDALIEGLRPAGAAGHTATS